MSRQQRKSSMLLLVTMILMMFSTFAGTAEQASAQGDEVTTTTISSGLSPAVSVDTTESAPVETDWTYRYMVPAALVLAVVIIVLTAIKYFTEVVRKRYRIIEE